MNAPHTRSHRETDARCPVPKRIIKRNLQVVAFDLERLNRTLSIIGKQHQEFGQDKQTYLCGQILRYLKHHQGGSPAPSVLQLQDAIAHSLLSHNYFKSAKFYMTHRAEQRILRQQRQRLKLLIRAMREETNHKPASTNNVSSPTVTTNLCLSLFAQIIHQTTDSLTERPELSEAIKESIQSLPSDGLVVLLTEIEVIIG